MPRGRPKSGSHVTEIIADRQDQVITGQGIIETNEPINEENVIVVPNIDTKKVRVISPETEKEIQELLRHSAIAVGQVYPVPEVGDVKVVDILVKKENPDTKVVSAERYTNTDETPPDDLPFVSVSLKYPRLPRTTTDVYKSISLKELFELVG